MTLVYLAGGGVLQTRSCIVPLCTYLPSWIEEAQPAHLLCIGSSPLVGFLSLFKFSPSMSLLSQLLAERTAAGSAAGAKKTENADNADNAVEKQEVSLLSRLLAERRARDCVAAGSAADAELVSEAAPPAAFTD